MVVAEVTPLGPADRRNIVRGEKNLEINGAAMRTPGDVRQALADVDPGEVVSLPIGLPDGTSQIVNIRAGVRDPPKGTRNSAAERRSVPARRDRRSGSVGCPWGPRAAPTGPLRDALY